MDPPSEIAMSMARPRALLLCVLGLWGCGADPGSSRAPPDAQPDSGAACTDLERFVADTAVPLAQRHCLNCHYTTGAAQTTRFVMDPADVDPALLLTAWTTLAGETTVF